MGVLQVSAQHLSCCSQRIRLTTENQDMLLRGFFFFGLFVGVFSPVNRYGFTSGLNTNSNPSYSAHKSFNINHNISTAQLFKTYTHTKSHTFSIAFEGADGSTKGGEGSARVGHDEGDR